jgi:hypothetical protein
MIDTTPPNFQTLYQARTDAHPGQILVIEATSGSPFRRTLRGKIIGYPTVAGSLERFAP